MSQITTLPSPKMQGTGAKKASLMGRFIFDVLDHMRVPDLQRQEKKQWLMQELFARLRREVDFPAEQRKLFNLAVLEEMNIPAERRDASAVWLARRLKQLITDFEQTV